ncbi:HVA22-like protein a isoform X2 [Nymphaea colorata]|uniref:HVA22-like protein a isoform X2 n=1 Tax=Nymphaea colorata TaxID=210225 RepID=UPI00129D6606|nr:HVA22-like protein a isoform X2 [Nymphaea colorata]
MGGGALLKVVAQHFDVLALPVVSLLYPLYASVKAIESESRHDDRQWLTIPVWSYAKLIATCWLVLPYFNGAAYVYEHFIRPCFVNPPPVNIWIFSGKKSIFNTLPDDCSSAVERYIADNGKEAFERLMAQAERETKSQKNHFGIFDYEDDRF